MIGRQGRTAYEVTVLGPTGPLLRAAFAGHRIAAIGPCTVIRVRVPPDRKLDLVDLVGLFESARVRVEDLYRVTRPEAANPASGEAATRADQTMSSVPGEARTPRSR
jgi:hypothetical protein